jgi:hypothetical protein
LESFQQEVADFHQQKHADRPRRKRNKMAEITVEQSEWDRIKSERDNALRDRDEALAKVTAAEAEKAQAVKDQEAAEATKIKAEEEAKTIKAELDTAKETARQVELADERFEKIGAGFQAKLGDKTKERLRTQAKSLSDDEWTARLEELEELTGVKIDEAAAPGKEDEFSKREIASAGFRPGGGSGDSPKEPAPAQRRSVIGALVGSGTKN